MARIDVVHIGETKADDQRTDLVRDIGFEQKGLLFARTRIKGGNVSPWHHHGKWEIFAFMISGGTRFEYVDGKMTSVEVEAGDFFRIPVGLVHRDTNLSPDDEAVMIVLFRGEGPTTVNTPEP